MGLKFKLFIIMCEDTMSGGVTFKIDVPNEKTAPAAVTKTAPKAVPVADPKAACKHGDQCRGCNVCGKGGKGGGAQVDQLASAVKTLKAELAGLKASSAATDAKLGKVEADVSETKSGITAMLTMMKEDRAQRDALPPPPARPAIMPPPSTQRSQSPPPRMNLVTSGPEGSFGQECGFWVPTLGPSKPTSTSSGPYTGQNGWADKPFATGGGGAMVVSKPTGALPSPSSLFKKEAALPSPSSLVSQSGKKASTFPSGSGLVRCTDQAAFFQALQSQGWNQMFKFLQSSKLSDHVLTAAVNACALSPHDEAAAVAIACFDRVRSASAFEPYMREHMRAAFNPENPAFKQFCIRMADFCSKSPDKGIEFHRVKYPYAYLAQNDDHRKELIVALKDN